MKIQKYQEVNSLNGDVMLGQSGVPLFYILYIISINTNSYENTKIPGG